MRVTNAQSCSPMDSGKSVSRCSRLSCPQERHGRDGPIAGQPRQQASERVIRQYPWRLMSGNLARPASARCSRRFGADFAVYRRPKANKKKEEAEAAWKKMADQVTAFNNAAAGFDLGPLTNELNSLVSNFESLRQALINLSMKQVTVLLRLASTRPLLLVRSGSSVNSRLAQKICHRCRPPSRPSMMSLAG